MKFKTLLITLPWFACACAQIPAGYYDDAQGLQGYELKTALKEIINNQTVLSYNNLDGFYSQTDKDLYYENDNSLLDMYSEKPNGPDAYNYGFGEGDQCGNYNSEADCWNKEHIFPQGFFNEQLPMRTDLHQVLPTDGYVNNRRSNYPFGKVGSASWTSTNGSKVGTSANSGFNGTVFEPIDEFKGDIARILFYFATRYEDQVTSNSWDDPDADPSNPLNGTSDQVYEDWQISVLLQWNQQDPVSQKEIDRNNKVYQIQGNRNPFVDHPEWVNAIWNPGAMNVSDVNTKSVQVYPNPVTNTLNIQSEENISKAELFDLNGRMIQSVKNNSNTIQLNTSHLNSGVYLLKTTVNGKTLTQKIVKK